MRHALLLLPLLTACNSFLTVPPPPPPPPGTPTLQALGTSFLNPLYVTSPPLDSQRVFVVEQDGRVRILRNDTLLAGSFRNLTGQISPGGQHRLSSIAYHPQYAHNR